MSFSLAELLAATSTRPTDEPRWAVEGHPDDRSLVFALEELNFFSKEFDILGVYAAHPYRDSFREAKD